MPSTPVPRPSLPRLTQSTALLPRALGKCLYSCSCNHLTLSSSTALPSHLRHMPSTRTPTRRDAAHVLHTWTPPGGDSDSISWCVSTKKSDDLQQRRRHSRGTAWFECACRLKSVVQSHPNETGFHDREQFQVFVLCCLFFVLATVRNCVSSYGPLSLVTALCPTV